MAEDDDVGGAVFLTFLAEVQDGRLADELSERLKRLIATMTDQARNAGGKPKGSMKIDITFKLEDGILDVSADVNVKPPKMSRARSVFYPLKDGGLSRENPKQIEMKLAARDVSTPIRDITSARVS